MDSNLKPSEPGEAKGDNGLAGSRDSLSSEEGRPVLDPIRAPWESESDREESQGNTSAFDGGDRYEKET